MSRPRKPWLRKSNKCWYVEIGGKQVNLGSDKKESHQRFHELMAQPEPNRKAPRTADISLPEVVDNFLDWVQRHRAADTYEWYRYRLQRLCQTYPALQASSLRPYHVEEWVAKYDIAVTTRRNYLRSIKRCYKWAKKQGYMTDNPIVDLEVPSGEHREVTLLREEFEELLEFVHNPQLTDLIRVTWETGCRPQESLIVEARHVDVDHQRWVFYKSESKGKKISRVVYLSDEAMAIVRRLMLAHPKGPIFRNSNGQPWTTDAVNCGFLAVQMRMGKKEMKRQGIEIDSKAIAEFIPSLSPTRTKKGRTIAKTPSELKCEAKRKLTHQQAKKLATRYSLYAIRHSFATNALRKGIDSLTVAILLGHEDPSTLARVYQHLNQNPEHLLDQARRAAG